MSAASVVAAMAFVLAVPAGPADAAGFACAGGLRYAVEAGDSWFSIASRGDIAVASLLEVNGAEAGDALHPGDVLCLPDDAGIGSVCAGAATQTVEPGDGWGAIASAAGVSVRSLLDANGADAGRVLHPGDVLCLPAGATAAPSGSGGGAGAASGARYTVARGDSWFAIASAAGVPVRALLEVNDASTSTVLRPGDEIVLPAGATTPTGGAAGGDYTVVSGDSWFAIAAFAGVTTRALLDVNDATRSTPLHPGDEIRLPEGADTEALEERGSRTVTLAALPTQGPCWYGDTWLDRRAGGRRHVGVDLFTERGQYVYAVVDGTLTSRSWDQPGRSAGNAWWLRAADGSATFFYAHLEDFAPDLEEGSRVRAGQIIGWVGDTGNASAVHLHFEVRPGGGDPVNPYPIIRAAGGCNRGTPYTQPGGWVPEPI